MPELELRQAAHEGLEFLVVLGREGGGLARGDAVFHVGVLLERGVEFGADECEEEVEEVDAEGVGDWSAPCVSNGFWVALRDGMGLTDVPALREDDPQSEHDEERYSAYPSVGYEPDVVGYN